MVKRKNRKSSGTIFVKSGLARALSSLREKNFHSQDGNKKRFYISGKEMVILGKLIYAWKDIAGLQLASKTRPFRFIKGKLLLTVSDSQWLQTLMFLKPEILTKIKNNFPDLNIKDIQGKLGKIPLIKKNYDDENNWPDWTKEIDIKLPEIKDKELLSIIQECQKKLKARMKGLETKGYILCKSCNSSYTKNSDGICAVCIFEERSKSLMKVRYLIAELPWVSYEECLKEESSLKIEEYEAIKSQILMDCLPIITSLGEQQLREFNHDVYIEMSKEMVRAIMLHTGQTPDEIDLFDLKKGQIIDPKWIEYLAVEGDE